MTDGFIQAENERVMSNMIRLGKVVELDEANARIRVETAGQETGWIPWGSSRAGATSHWSAPRVGEQMVVLSPYGDLAQAVAIGGIYSDDHPAPGNSKDVEQITFPDGSKVTYDSAAHELRLTAGSAKVFITCTEATVTASSKVTLDTAEVKVTGDVKVDGKVEVVGDVTSNGDVKAGSISLKTHKHGGVQAGGAQTGTPV